MDELTFYTLQLCLVSFYFGWKYKYPPGFLMALSISIFPILGLLDRWIEITDKHFSRTVFIWVVTTSLLFHRIIVNSQKGHYPILPILISLQKEAIRLISVFIAINVFYWTIRSLNIYWSILITGISTLGWLLLIKRFGGTSFIDRKIKECRESESWKKFWKGVTRSEEVPRWTIIVVAIGVVIYIIGNFIMIMAGEDILLIIIGGMLSFVGPIMIGSIVFYFFGHVLHRRCKNKENKEESYSQNEED